MLIKTKNHKIEVESFNNHVMLRSYYKDNQGMYNHMGDTILTIKETFQLTDTLKEVIKEIKMK